MTNAERIRKMTDDELAVFLTKFKIHLAKNMREKKVA